MVGKPGVPVQYCDSPALECFRRALRVAVAWANAGTHPTIPIEGLIESSRSLSGVEPDMECLVVEELGAAVRSFIASPQAPEGVYVLLDIGAGTLDGVAFRYVRLEGRPNLICHAAAVEPLGIAAVAERLAREAGVASRDMELRLNGSAAATDMPGLDDVREEIRSLLVRILLEGKRKDHSGWSAGIDAVGRAWYRGTRDSTKFPLFVGGGGSLSDFYRHSMASTYSARRLADTNIKPYRLETVPVPRDLEMHGLLRQHFHRFAVAYGLSIPPGESGGLVLPSMVPPEPGRPRRRSDSPRYEDTKDLT
jgi:hypothetical protein